MEGRVCAIFVVVQFLGGSIDILDFFHRAWNAELLRNAAAVPTGCLLRFPLLRLQDPHTPHTTNIGSGVVASLHSSGALRVATSGSIEHALAIADFVHAYVSRRLPAAYTSLGATKSITFFQVVLYPAPSQQEGTHNNNNSNSNSNKKTGKKKQEVEEVDTSENGAKWLRERIAFYTSTSHHHHHTYTTSTSGMGGIMNNNNNNNNNNNKVYTHWWRYVTDISVAPQQYRRTLRIVCHFKTPPVSHTIPQTINNINNNHNHINDINNNMNNSIQTIERDADAFFFGSELMSVIPMGSVFVAAPHSTGGRKRSRREDEMEMFSHHHPDDNNHEDPSQAVEPNIEEEEEEEEEEKITTPLKEEKEEKEKEEKERVPMVSLCPLVPKAQLKVEALVYRTGRVFVTADSVEALSFVVEQVLLPLFRKDGTIEFN